MNSVRIDDLNKVKKILSKALDIPCDKLSPAVIMQHLKAKGALDADEEQTINSGVCDRDKIEKLLNIFHRKSVIDYEKLRIVLAQAQPDMYDELVAIEIEHDYKPQQKIGMNYIEYNPSKLEE